VRGIGALPIIVKERGEGEKKEGGKRGNQYHRGRKWRGATPNSSSKENGGGGKGKGSLLPLPTIAITREKEEGEKKKGHEN